MFSDNYFDMLPNEKVVVEFTPFDKDINNQPDFNINTLYELHELKILWRDDMESDMNMDWPNLARYRIGK